MLENGMIVGATYYDRQCREVPCEKCEVCGELIPITDTKEILGYTVCEDCIGELVEGYIPERSQSYAMSDPEYFTKYWLPSLEPQDRDELLKQAYQQFRRKTEYHDFFVSLEQEFSRDNMTDFIDYMEGSR